MPNPDLLDEKNIVVEGIAMSELLRIINKRIEVLKDCDHTIGHSYFLKIEESDDKVKALHNVMYDKIIPLLQEYFFNDYGQMQLVLGKGFINQQIF